MASLSNSLYSLRFKAIAQQKDSLDGEAAYSVIRAHLVLGDYSSAQKKITSLSKLSIPPRWLTLLQIQLDAFTCPANKTRIEHLENWLARESPTLTPFLLGEARFTLGYLQGAVSHYKMALREFAAAIRYYEHVQMDGHAGIARFNYCLCAHHLGLELERDSEFDRFTNDAKSFYKKTNNPVLVAFADRFGAYRAIERGDLSLAAEKLKSARSQFLILDRKRDAGEMFTFEMIVALKMQRMNQFYELAEKTSELNLDSPVIKNRLFFLQKIADLGFPSLKEVLALIKSAKDSKVDGVTLVIMGDLLLNALLTSGAYQDVITAHRSLSSLPTKHEQAPWLIDYNYYLVEALKHAGRESESSNVAHTMLIHKNRSSLCVIDLREGIIQHEGKQKNVQSHPLVIKMLWNLHSAPEGLDYEDLFERVYEHPFHIVRHQSRYHSLISRTRKFLPNGMIEWNDNRIRFNPEHPIHLISPRPSANHAIQRRQKILLEKIAKKPSLTLTDLSEILQRSGNSISRRTLQYDLEKLAKSNQIDRIGHGKNIRYKLKKGSP